MRKNILLVVLAVAVVVLLGCGKKAADYEYLSQDKYGDVGTSGLNVHIRAAEGADLNATVSAVVKKHDKEYDEITVLFYPPGAEVATSRPDHSFTWKAVDRGTTQNF